MVPWAPHPLRVVGDVSSSHLVAPVLSRSRLASVCVPEELVLCIQFKHTNRALMRMFLGSILKLLKLKLCPPDTTDLSRIVPLPWHLRRALRRPSTSPDRKMVKLLQEAIFYLETQNRHCVYLKQQISFPKLLSKHHLLKDIHGKLFTGLYALALTWRSFSFISDLEASLRIK